MRADELFPGTSGIGYPLTATPTVPNTDARPQPGGQAIVGTTPIVSTLQGPFNALTSLDLFSTGTVAGAWKIEVSNSYANDLDGLVLAGRWTDVTAAFRTPDATTGTVIAAVVTGGTHQYVQFMGYNCAGLAAKSLRVTFTPASGAGNIGFAVNSVGTAAPQS